MLKLEAKKLLEFTSLEMLYGQDSQMTMNNIPKWINFHAFKKKMYFVTVWTYVQTNENDEQGNFYNLTRLRVWNWHSHRTSELWFWDNVQCQIVQQQEPVLALSFVHSKIMSYIKRRNRWNKNQEFRLKKSFWSVFHVNDENRSRSRSHLNER